MTIPFPKGQLRLRLADTSADVAACQALRHTCFFGTAGRDFDDLDAHCQHLMVLADGDVLVATARLQFFEAGASLAHSYAARHYDLAALTAQNAPMIEVGRFCIAPHAVDADVLRMAWGGMTGLVDDLGVRFLFGCSSFQGTDPARFGRTFACLHERHLGPAVLRPSATGPEAVSLAETCGQGSEPLPPLLRTYLAMGGWVGEHATIDRHLNTMHVFTCVDVQNVPPARAKALRALAQGITLA